MRIAIVVLLLAVSPAPLIPPPYVSDEELAKYPIIVVARWDGTHLVDRDKVVGNELKEPETGARILIERVIVGKVPLEGVDILITDRFGWTKKHPIILTYTSSEMCGDVEDVGRPNLWFMNRGRSWKPEDSKEYLLLDNYRCVQPLKLEGYFDALRSPAAEREVPKLLLSQDSEIVRRVMSYICGGQLSWPFHPDGFFEPTDERKRFLTAQAPEVLKLTDPKRPAETRRVAAAVYAELAGEEALPRVRTFLKDPDHGLRTITVGLLARARDAGAATDLVAALRGSEDGWLAYFTIQALGEWDDPAALPPLMTLLENDKETMHIRQEFSNVALNARAVLLKRTGVSFPLNSTIALRAWKQTDSIAEVDERKRKLEELLGADAAPLEADVVNRNGRPHVLVRNRSKSPLWVARRPQTVSLQCEGGSGGSAGGEITGRESFVELPPDGISEIEITTGDFLDYFLRAPRSSREIVLEYLRNGNEFGLKAWMGVVIARCGEKWEEPPRKEGVVEEHWPNGKLKSKGTMVDGRRHGLWTHWNEDGKKVREWEWRNGSPSKFTLFNADFPGPEDKAGTTESTALRRVKPPVGPEPDSQSEKTRPYFLLGLGLIGLLLAAGIWRIRRGANRRPSSG